MWPREGGWRGLWALMEGRRVLVLKSLRLDWIPLLPLVDACLDTRATQVRIPSINQPIGAVQSSAANGPLAGKQGVVLFQPVPPVPAVGQKPAEERSPSSLAQRSTLSGADTVELSRSSMARLANSLAVAGKDCEECEEEELAEEKLEETKLAEQQQTEVEPNEVKGADGEALDPKEKAELTEMQSRDREVRAHEQAHQAAAGSLSSGGPTFTYETGPDGRQYVVGGEVQISLKEGSTPEETIRLAQQARAAALAPGEPSGRDLSVAAKASRRENAARAEAYSSTSETGKGPNLQALFA